MSDDKALRVAAKAIDGCIERCAILARPWAEGPGGRGPPQGAGSARRDGDGHAPAGRLKSCGIEIEEGPVDRPWQARHAWLRDPDGRRMSIYSTDTPTMAMTSVEEG